MLSFVMGVSACATEIAAQLQVMSNAPMSRRHLGGRTWNESASSRRPM
jgi:hypothetical protein